MNGGAAKDVLDFFVLNENGTVTPDPDRTDGDLSFKFNLSRCDPSLPEASAKCEWSTTRFCNDTLIDAKELSAALPSNIKNSTLSRRASKLSIRNTIKSFAPDMLMTYMLKRMALKDDSAMTPFSTVFDGVCLLADISGFTRLSGRFCEDGKDGIDQLQQATNGYLSILIEIVYAYGGDVMKFAGDALVCVFQASGVDNGGVRKVTLSDVCTSAVQCATELTQVCTNQLTVHVALSCGPICLSMLGGYNDLWECLISGECLGHLSKCLDDAGSKQAVVSPEFTEALGPIYRKELNIEKLPSGNFLVISAAQMTSKVIKKMIMKRTAMLMKHSESRFSMFPNDNAFIRDVSKFIPLPVSIGLMSGSFDYLAELREVTTMFMSWDSYNEVIHRDLLSLQGYFTTAQEVLGNSGGFIRQFLIDDKGCVLIACWGVPTASHPDNTRRALCAGAIIGQKLSALGMETSVGITTGNVFCGSVGSYVRREYAVIGDVVNLAARLMGKADSGLLLDEATFLSLPRYLKLLMGEMKPITVKGRDKPIASYRLKKSEKILDFNDRDDTDVLLDTLTKPAVFEDTILREIESATRKSTVLKTIIVEGKAGLSTMEISKWLIGIGIKMNIRVISMQMMSKNSCNEYSMAAQLFRLLVGKDEFDEPKGQQVIVDKILQEVYKSEQETAKKVAYPSMRIALGVTCPLDNSDNQDYKAPRLPPKLINQCLADVFTYLFNETRVIVAVEYAHYIDTLSWNVLLNLANKPSRALMVFTVSPVDEILSPKQVSSKLKSQDEVFLTTGKIVWTEKLSVVFRRMVQMESTILVRQSSYSVLEVYELLRSALDQSCPGGLACMVHQLSGGDPFWCREMVLYIKDTGASEFMRAMNPTETNLDATDCMSFTPDLNSSTASWTPPRFFKGISKAALKPIFGEFTRHESGSGKYSVMSTDLEPATSPKVMRRSYMIDGVFLDAIVTRPDDRFSTKSGRNTTTTSKLELFIVCRFGKLSSEDQNLLRIASIVGLLFSKELLFGILSPQMRQHMESSVQSLRRQQWIADSTEESAEYCFVHPLFYQTLYNLTPAGDRAKLHYAVAQFLQQEHEDDPIYFSRLGHHYSLSVGQRPQAFEYFIRSAIHIFTKGPSFIDSGIKLMHHARSFVDTAMDCELVLGICKKEKDRLMKLKQKILQEESVTPSLTRTSFLSLPSRGSFLSIPYRTTKVLPLYSSQKNGSKEGAYEGNDITLEEINHNLDLCDSTEVEYYEIYGEMVYRNLMGEAARWQIPYFRGLLTVGNVARKKSFFFNSADQVDRSPDVSRVVRSLFSTRINTKVTKASEYKFKPQRRRSSHLLAMILSGKKTSSKRNMQQSIKSQVKELIGCSIS